MNLSGSGRPVHLFHIAKMFLISLVIMSHAFFQNNETDRSNFF
jgi:hypothetical protein